MNLATDVQISHHSDYDEKSPAMQLLVQYMTVLTITALNTVLPAIFKVVVRWEDYTYAVEVNWTLGR